MQKRTKLILAGFGFTVEESKEIVENGVIRFYPRNSIILQTPLIRESLFIVLEGPIMALALESEGKETTLAHYETGDHFGSGEFGDAPYSVTCAICKTAAHLSSILPFQVPENSVGI